MGDVSRHFHSLSSLNDHGCGFEPVTFQTTSLRSFRTDFRSNTLFQTTPLIWEQTFPFGHAVAPQEGPHPVVLLSYEEYQTWKALPSTFSPLHLERHRVSFSRWRRWLVLGLVRPANHVFHPSNLTLWFQITQACPLDCLYCYVPKRARSMSMAVARRAFMTFLHRAKARNVSHLHIKYAGGEPTLRIRWLARFHRWALDTARAHGITLTGSVITNGLNLTSQVLRTLRELNLTLSISWDGPAMAHDAQRPARNRLPTEGRVRQAILRAHAWGLTPRLIMTVTAHNVDHLPQMARFALTHRLPFHFNLYRQPLPGKPTPLIPPEARLLSALDQALEVLRAHLEQVTVPLPYLLGMPAGGPGHACGAGQTYFAIGVQGQIRGCHMLLDTTAQTRTRVHVFHTTQRGECATCPWRVWCGGGCPLHTFQLTGRWDRPSPYCRIYKHAFPRLLELEARRLHLQVQRSLEGQPTMADKGWAHG